MLNWPGGGKVIFGPPIYLTPRPRSPDRVGVETQRTNRDSGVKGLRKRERGNWKAKFGIRNSEIGKRKRAGRTTGGREVGLILSGS